MKSIVPHTVLHETAEDRRYRRSYSSDTRIFYGVIKRRCKIILQARTTIAALKLASQNLGMLFKDEKFLILLWSEGVMVPDPVYLILDHGIYPRDPAIQAGGQITRISKSLNISPRIVRNHTKLTKGLSPVVKNLLTKAAVSKEVFAHFRRMTPFHQLETVAFMHSVQNYSTGFTRGLIAATPPEHLVNPKMIAYIEGVPLRFHPFMRVELQYVERAYAEIETYYGQDLFCLQVIKAFLRSLLKNAKVADYLQNQRTVELTQLRRIINMETVQIYHYQRRSGCPRNGAKARKRGPTRKMP